jgi:CHAD domain-containing protein
LISGSPGKPLSAKAQRRLERAAVRSYCLHDGEDPDEGLRRVAHGRVDSAVERLRRDAETDLAKAVHDTRKDMKKLRSLLRLVRDGLGPDRYRAENGRYRDAAGLLSGARDAEVKLETLAGLRERYPHEAPPAERLERTLEEERERLAGDGRDSEVSGRLEEAAAAIEQGGAEVDAWEFSSAGFGLMRPGLERSYRRGRDSLRAVREDPSAEVVHEWRKRVKDLWYHLRLLRDLWPAAMTGAADEAHVLSDLLGDHHDLTVLIDEARDRTPDDPDLDTLATLARRRQGELLEEALPIGERLYAEKPKQFTGRLAVYWKASHDGSGA